MSSATNSSAAQSSLLVQIVLAEQGLEQFGATVGKALQIYQAHPVGLQLSRFSLRKRKASSPGVAKWLALGVSEADWRILPDTAKAFLAALLQVFRRH